MKNVQGTEKGPHQTKLKERPEDASGHKSQLTVRGWVFGSD